MKTYFCLFNNQWPGYGREGLALNLVNRLGVRNVGLINPLLYGPLRVGDRIGLKKFLKEVEEGHIPSADRLRLKRTGIIVE